MARAEHSIVIDRPAEEVFDYLADASKLPTWQDSVESARQETEGPVGVGTRVVETRRFLGRRLEQTLDVTTYERPRRLDLRVVEGPVRYVVTHTLEPSGPGTRVDVAVEGETGGFFKVAEPLVARQGRKQLQGDFAKLKQLLESS